MDHDDAADRASDRAAADRAVRLLRFLAEVTPPVAPGDRDVASERVVVRLDALPDHPAVRLGTAPELVSMAPIARRIRPVVPPELMPWISGDPDRPSSRLRLRATTARWNEAGAEAVPLVERLTDRPDIRAPWEDWHAHWQEWSQAVRSDAPAADLHARLSRLVGDLESDAARSDVVLGLGLLDRPGAGIGAGGDRHLFTVPLRVGHDASGRITIGLDPHRRGLEVDPAVLAGAPDRAEVITAAARTYAGPLDDGAALAEVLAASPDGTGQPATAPVVLRPAPTVLVRSSVALDSTRLTRWADGIARTGRVPAGLMPLVDRAPAPAPVTTPGALLTHDDIALCPFPLTPAQRQVVEAIDTHHQTLVLAAPGPQRARTIAALVTHLLAQGRRVLVTGPSESSLREVAAATPESLVPLVVATTGDRPAAAAIDAVTRCFVEPSEYGDEVARASERLKELLARRDQLAREAVLSREDEVRDHTVRGRTGTLAQLARRHLAESEFAPLEAHVSPALDEPAPLTSAQATRLRDLLLDPTLRRLTPRFHGHRPNLHGVPDSREFARLVAQFEFTRRAGAHGDLTADPRWVALSTADAGVRREIRGTVEDIQASVREAANSHAWAATAIRDIAHGEVARWRDLARILDARLAAAIDAVEAIGAEITQLGDVPDLPTRIDYLREHLVATGPLVVGETGIPRLGVQVPNPVRIGHVLFMNLRVDGAPPVTIEALDTLTVYLAAGEALNELEGAWPDDTVIPVETSPRARLAWHAGRVRHLLGVLDLTGRIAVVTGLLTALDLPAPDWSDPLALDDLDRLLSAAEDEDAARAAAVPLTDLTRRLSEAADTPEAPDAQGDLCAAARALDVDAYAHAWDELAEITSRAEELDELATLADPLQPNAPSLLRALVADPSAATWRVLGTVEEAWDHCARASWLTDRIDVDPNVLAAELALVEDHLVAATEAVAAARAWAAAVVPERLPTHTRVDLALCAHLTRRLAGGHGSPRQHAELDRVRARCRAAVPAWMVPLHRLTEQFDLTAGADPEIADVVIVTDASDTGTEANLLRALAPRIVLFGDRVDLPDPTDQAQDRPGDILRGRVDLAEKYLWDNPHRSSWENPRRSLFGDARLRGGARINLEGPESDPGGHDSHDAPGASSEAHPASDVVDQLREMVSEQSYPTRLLANHLGLVVLGQHGEVVVVFEDQNWAGPAAYLRELAAQRRLGRKGRPVHRIRESAFLLDRARELSAL